MIEIQGIGIYDDAKGFFEQDEPVNTYLTGIAGTFNDFTATERDAWNRPTDWKYIGEGVVITSHREYNTQDGNYFLKSQTFNIEQDGNI